MKYFFILFVIALALAPLTHFLPSKKQRKIARMREYAALHGLFVEFRDPPGGNRGGERPASVIYYGKRFPASVSARVERGAWVRTGRDWRSVEGRVPVPPQLHELQVEILAAGVDGSSCGVYWTESAAEESVEEIRQSLEHWLADLTG